MEKSHYENEIDRLIIAVKELEEKEIAINKLNVLFGRIKSEIEHSSDNDEEALQIEKELVALVERGYCNE